MMLMEENRGNKNASWHQTNDNYRYEEEVKSIIFEKNNEPLTWLIRHVCSECNIL